jgi:hypothetical protein
MSKSAQRHVRQRAAPLTEVYDAAILAAGPVAYWTLAGGSAGISDRTGHGHNGTYLNGFAATTFPDGSLATVFNGSSQYIEISNDTTLSVPATGILTVEAWLRPDALEFPGQEDTGYVHWLGKGESGQHEYAARMYSFTNSEVPSRPNSISGYAFNLAGGLGVGSFFQDTVVAGQWIHYVLTINTIATDGTYPTGYVQVSKNGEQRDKDSLSDLSIVPVHGTAPLRIGTRDLASFFKGAVSKVAVYNYELAATAIRDHYQLVVPLVAGSAAFVKNVGSALTKTAGTTLTLAVPSGGVAAGRTLLVKVAHEYTAGGPTVIDSRGNAYTRDQTSPNGGTTMRASLFSAPINAALLPGDTIQLTTSASVGAKAMSIDEFSGIVFTSSLDQVNSTSATSTTPGDAIPITTTQADDLLVGFLSVNGPVEETYIDDSLAQWTGLTRIGTTGGVATSNVMLNNAYKSVGTTGTYKYKPTLGTSESWIEIIASYKAGTPVIVPPVQGTATLVKNIGSASAKVAGTTLTFTIPAGGVPIGHTLITRVFHDYTSGGPAMADARGNTYVRDRTAANTGTTIRGSLFSCRVTTALQTGDVITLTLSASVTARAASVDEFANVLLPITIDAQNGLAGASAAPTLPVTTTFANDLIIGMVGVEGDSSDSYGEDTLHQWTSLSRAGTTGGVADTNVTVNGVYRAAGSTGTYTYAPTLGTSSNWIEFLVAYKAA